MCVGEKNVIRRKRVYACGAWVVLLWSRLVVRKERFSDWLVRSPFFSLSNEPGIGEKDVHQIDETVCISVEGEREREREGLLLQLLSA